MVHYKCFEVTMNRNEVEKAINEFEKRSELLDSSKHSGHIYRKYDCLNIFISDANYLKNLDVEINDSMKSFTFQRKDFQYVNLSKDELLTYIAARTAFRNGKLPNISRLEFLIYIYVFEIVSGIHGDGYKTKRDMLDTLMKLFPFNVSKYDKVFIEVYEVLFLQYHYLFDIDEYFKSIPLNLFEGCSFIYDGKIPVKYMTTDEIFHLTNEYIYKKKINKTYNLNDKIIFDECFDYVRETVDYKIKEQGLSITTIDNIIKYELQFVWVCPYKNMMVAYPQRVDLKLTDSKNKMHYFHYGFHSTMKYKSMELRSEAVYEITEYIMNSLNLDLKKQRSNEYAYWLSKASKSLAALIKDAVVEWVGDHPYANKYNEISAIELQTKIQEYNENPEKVKNLGSIVEAIGLSGNITLDSYDDGILLVHKYIERAISKNELSGRYTKFEEFYNKTINPNDRSIDLFLIDAIKLKDIDCCVIRKTAVCHFSKDLIQYYLLKFDSLFGYFGFRTQIRGNIVPVVNKYSEYLMLYLTEIVNGVHGDSYIAKRSLLDNTLFLANEKATYKELLTEAYEILYLQHCKELDYELYQRSISLSIFVGYQFTKKKDVNIYSPSMEHVFMEMVSGIAIYESKDRFLLKASFDFVINEICDKDISVEGFNLINLFKFNTLKCDNYQLKKIKAKYPEDLVINFVDDLQVFHLIYKGVHSKYHYYYEPLQKSRILFLLNHILYSLYKYCGGADELDNPYSTLWALYNRSELPVSDQNIIDTAVFKWVSKDKKHLSKVLKASADFGIKYWFEKNVIKKVKKTPEIPLEVKCNLDISDVEAVRKASNKIQEKLIIEDEIETKELKSLNKTKKKEEEVDNDGTLHYVVKSMTSFDGTILNLLIDFKVNQAIELAKIEGVSLELIVDRINELSMQCIEDVLIINNEVVNDYLSDLVIALKRKRN